jgi:hypothetical protein
MPLGIGSIIHIFDPLCTPPKDKFVVIVAQCGDTYATAYINTNINPMDLGVAKAASLQVLLKQEDHPFLHYDSYLSATDLKERPCADLETHVINEPRSYKGELKRENLLEVIQKFKTGGVIKPKLLVKYTLK